MVPRSPGVGRGETPGRVRINVSIAYSLGSRIAVGGTVQGAGAMPCSIRLRADGNDERLLAGTCKYASAPGS